MTRRLPFLAAVLATALLWTMSASGQVTADVPGIRPDAIVNLATAEGASLVRGEWRYSDASVVDAERTHDIEPHAGVAPFDDSGWPVIEPESLESRRTHGRLSFGWYRIAVTIPEKVGALETAGSTVVFEIVVDDYAEVWVDGKLPIALGQAGGQFIKGFNAPNRVVIAREAGPGQP